MMEQHIPVLCTEVINLLSDGLQDDRMVCIDATLGAGGHAKRFLEQFSSVQYVGIDADNDMLDIAEKELEKYSNRISLYNMWFDDFFANVPINREDKVGAIIFDLGISQWHYRQDTRGFSFDSSALPDMRMTDSLRYSAHDILYRYKASELAEIFASYGEERYAQKIANAIIRARTSQDSIPCNELASIVRSQYPKQRRYRFPHPATRVFQALRIEVNAELQRLEEVLPLACRSLAVGGRMGVISFHSLEDRIVKRYYKSFARNTEEHSDDLRIMEVTKKPVFAAEEEVENNPASRSARLRVLERVA